MCGRAQEVGEIEPLPLEAATLRPLHPVREFSASDRHVLGRRTNEE